MGVIPPWMHSASSSCREVVAEPEGSVAMQSPELKLGGRRAWGQGRAWGAGLCGVSCIDVRTQAHGHGLCMHACTHACTHVHAHSCRHARADLLHMHGCMRAHYTCTRHAHTCTPMHAHTHTPASRVFSTRGQQTPTAARTRGPAPRLHTRALPAACTHGYTRGCAQPRAPHAHDPPLHQTRHVNVGEEKRWEETRRGGTRRTVGITSGCRASRVGMLTVRGRRWSRRGAAAGGAARSGCGPRSLRPC